MFSVGKKVRPALQAVKPVLESGQTGLMSLLDRSVMGACLNINKHRPFDMKMILSNHTARCLICQYIRIVIAHLEYKISSSNTKPHIRLNYWCKVFKPAICLKIASLDETKTAPIT